MGRIDSKQKGSSFERKVCQCLSLWVSGGARGDVFWRSAMSGGRATVKSRRALGIQFDAQAGDVSAIHPLGEPLISTFVVECKRWRDFRFDQLVHGTYKSNALYVEWQKLVDISAASGKLPMMVAKMDRLRRLTILDDAGLHAICGLHTIWPTAEAHKPIVYARFPRLGMNVCDFESMLAIDFTRLKDTWDAQAKDSPRRRSASHKSSKGRVPLEGV